MSIKILLVYPNLPLMMSPAMSMGLFNAIGKRMDCTVELFETTQYSEQYDNRHIRMTEIGASRQNKKDEIQDMFWIKDPKQIIPDFVNKVESYNPDLILMSVQEDVWRMATRLMDSIAHLNIPHVLGGQFPTNAPNVVINWPSVNCLARHEGENVVIDIINCIKQGESFENVKGLWYKKDNQIKKNPPAQLCNISETMPDYDCFQGARWKRPMGGKIFERAISMETYRGCPYNCTYCNSPTTRNLAKDFKIGNFMRRKSATVIEQELIKYIDIYNPDLVMFQDDSFLARPAKEIFEFCEMWSKYKIPFWFNTRIENCKPEYLEALKEAGVYRMTFGIESGNEQYRRDILQRNANNYTYYKFLDYINESNIPYSLNVILGMPFETRQMVMDTAEFVHKARGYDGLTISMWQPYHGTDLRTMAEKAGFLDPNYICGWESKSEVGGGFMDDWVIRMPEPYLQPDDVHKLVKTFALYAHFGPEKFDVVKNAETNETLYKELFDIYKQQFFGDIQEGGADRIQRFCAMHDASSTYTFEEV
jgi:hypothetical protein